MSTRCQIFIKEGGKPVATMYRHCDGYPSGMGEDLMDAITHRGCDATHLVHRLLCNYKFEAVIEPVDTEHGDTEFEYVVEYPEWYDPERGKPVVAIIDLNKGGKELVKGDYFAVTKWLYDHPEYY